MLLILNKIKQYSKKKATPVSLEYLFNYGKDFKNENLFRHSQFLHNELPLRIAKRIINLQELPYELNDFYGIQEIHDSYISSFDSLLKAKYPKNMEDSNKYVELLNELKNKHTDTEFKIAKCIHSFKRKYHNYEIYSDLINNKLNRFYESRISLRILTEHHIALKQNKITEKNIGIIFRFKIEDIIKNCIQEAKNIMSQKYSNIPNVKVDSLNSKEINHIPNHIHYIFFEIIKNSMEAVLKNKSNVTKKDIEIKVIHNNDGVTIHIFDEGGGFNFDQRNKLVSFLYTTNDLYDYEPDMTPISGFGHGLGMSKLYIEYFGGSLYLLPLENYGTHTIINLKSLKLDTKSIADTKY